jgi:ectoine hydroxylase-related dioxygenase (phytanoyl-CoA dioxygenase family)
MTGNSLRQEVEKNGYVVVPGVVPRQNLNAVVADIFRHTGADPDKRESWYLPGIISRAGMVEMYQFQSMWDNRQFPALYDVFRQVMCTEQLWVSLDRANMKPPADPRHPEIDDSFIHWDTDTSKYPDIPFRVQGVLALTDTDDSMGGFQCVPELYRQLADWIKRQAADRHPRKPDLTGYEITKVVMQAGDLVVWSTLLPHGNGHNLSDRPRLAQYITMSPAREDDDDARQKRIDSWQRHLPGPGFPGDARKNEVLLEPQSATLTALGRKLLGSDRW